MNVNMTHTPFIVAIFYTIKGCESNLLNCMTFWTF